MYIYATEVGSSPYMSFQRRPGGSHLSTLLSGFQTQHITVLAHIHYLLHASSRAFKHTPVMSVQQNLFDSESLSDHLKALKEQEEALNDNIKSRRKLTEKLLQSFIESCGKDPLAVFYQSCKNQIIRNEGDLQDKERQLAETRTKISAYSTLLSELDNSTPDSTVKSTVVSEENGE
jgi:inorganic triphosphatase YgiF